MERQARDQTASPFTRVLLAGQSLFYVVTGLWPLFSIRTFEAVTGPKTDRWLVKTVGLLITVIGAVLGLAAVRQRDSAETTLLAVGSAACLTAVDVVYVARGRLSKVYLLDAVAEGALIAAWGVSRTGRRPTVSPTRQPGDALQAPKDHP